MENYVEKADLKRQANEPSKRKKGYTSSNHSSERFIGNFLISMRVNNSHLNKKKKIFVLNNFLMTCRLP